MTDNTALLAFIAIITTIVSALSYMGKRSADAKYDAQRQQYDLEMAELRGRQTDGNNISTAMLELAKSIQSQTNVQAESNRLAAAERAAHTEQQKAFTATAAASAEAELALASAVEIQTSTLAAIQSEAAKQFMANAQVIVNAKQETVDALTEVIAENDDALGIKFDNLKASVETALERMEHGIIDAKAVKVLLERVNAHLDRQQHDARNDLQIAVLTEATKRRTGEQAAVPPPDTENGSETPKTS